MTRRPRTPRGPRNLKSAGFTNGLWRLEERAAHIEKRKAHGAPRPGSALDYMEKELGRSKRNPRNRKCPTCGEPNRLTPKDVSLGYQCDSCADRAEQGGW